MDIRDNLMEFKGTGRAKMEVTKKEIKEIRVKMETSIEYVDGSFDPYHFDHKLTPQQLDTMPQGKLYVLNEIVSHGVKQVFGGLVQGLKKTFTNSELGLPPEIHG